MNEALVGGDRDHEQGGQRPDDGDDPVGVGHRLPTTGMERSTDGEVALHRDDDQSEGTHSDRDTYGRGTGRAKLHRTRTLKSKTTVEPRYDYWMALGIKYLEYIALSIFRPVEDVITKFYCSIDEKFYWAAALPRLSSAVEGFVAVRGWSGVRICHRIILYAEMLLLTLPLLTYCS